MTAEPEAPAVAIFIADDHPVVTAGLRALLSTQDGYHVVGQAADGSALRQALARQAVDLVLLDLNMPDMEGVNTVQALRAAFPALRIVILTASTDAIVARLLLDAGAAGYVHKNDDGDDLLLALREVLAGRRYVSRGIGLDDAKGGALIGLTRRERQLLAMIGDGGSNADIAAALGISVATARKHRENLRRKLDVHSAAQLAALAVVSGLSKQST